jgi:hypothetical protein
MPVLADPSQPGEVLTQVARSKPQADSESELWCQCSRATEFQHNGGCASLAAAMGAPSSCWRTGSSRSYLCYWELWSDIVQTLSSRCIRRDKRAEDTVLHWAMQHWVLLPSRFYHSDSRAVPSRSVWQHYGAGLVHVLWILCHGALLSSRFNHRHRRAMSCWDVQQCRW